MRAPRVAAACALALALPLAPGRAAADPPAGPVAVLMAGPECPDPSAGRELENASRRFGGHSPHHRVAAALARVRAGRALGAARRLYTRTDFSGCIALLSITEQELGRYLADPDAARERQAHQRLAQVNLWLGICQWAAGDPQTAASSFVRAAQLPDPPRPDPKLLPPELVEAHRLAVSAARPDQACELEAPLRAEYLQLDGRPVFIPGRSFRVASGTHYLTIKVQCGGGADGAQCLELQQRLGGGGVRSLRLVAGPVRCRVPLPSTSLPPRVTCASLTEVNDSTLVAAVAAEAGAASAFAASAADRRVALRLHRRGTNGFSRQLITEVERGDSTAVVLARSMQLLLGEGPGPKNDLPPPPPPWYRRWWVWTLVGAAVVATTASAVALTRGEPKHKVVFP